MRARSKEVRSGAPRAITITIAKEQGLYAADVRGVKWILRHMHITRSGSASVVGQQPSPGITDSDLCHCLTNELTDHTAHWQQYCTYGKAEEARQGKASFVVSWWYVLCWPCLAYLRT